MEVTTGKTVPLIKGVCQKCHTDALLVQTSFVKNTGIVILSVHQTTSGFFCRRCVKSLFIEAQIHNLALGWWGIVSFFIINPMYLLVNSWRYYFAFRKLNKYSIL